MSPSRSFSHRCRRSAAARPIIAVHVCKHTHARTHAQAGWQGDETGTLVCTVRAVHKSSETLHHHHHHHRSKTPLSPPLLSIYSLSHMHACIASHRAAVRGRHPEHILGSGRLRPLYCQASRLSFVYMAQWYDACLQVYVVSWGLVWHSIGRSSRHYVYCWKLRPVSMGGAGWALPTPTPTPRGGEKERWIYTLHEVLLFWRL